MSKIKLVLWPDEFTSFTSYYLEDLWRDYFDINLYQKSKIYDRASTIFVRPVINVDNDQSIQLRECGYCVVVDNLWETAIGKTDYYYIENPNWFWYNESLWWQSLGYMNYTPNRNFNYRALMPIRKQNRVREHILKVLSNELDSILWSYGDSKKLPNDITDLESGQRFFNPMWYDSCWSSLVVETDQNNLFITEKTFKPIGFYHPFQIISAPGILKQLKHLGFETFENLFDESYDNNDNLDDRLHKIINNLQSIELNSYDQLTKQKLQHNHARFFNKQLIRQRVVEEIIYPLIEHVQSNT